LYSTNSNERMYIEVDFFDITWSPSYSVISGFMVQGGSCSAVFDIC